MVYYKKKEKKFDKNILSNCLFKYKFKLYIKMNKLVLVLFNIVLVYMYLLYIVKFGYR